MYTVQECRKQAKELGCHHLPQLLQVKFTDSEIKFVPDTSDIHAEIKTKATPVVSIIDSSPRSASLCSVILYKSNMLINIHACIAIHQIMNVICILGTRTWLAAYKTTDGLYSESLLC